MAPKLQLSGIQKQVLRLYRGFLRAARAKAPEERRRIEEVVSAEFRHNSRGVDRKNFLYIEYLIRRGKRQLDQLNSPGTVGLSTLKFHRSVPLQLQVNCHHLIPHQMSVQRGSARPPVAKLKLMPPLDI